MFDQKTEKGRRATEAEGRRENTVNQGSQGDGPSPFAAPSISLPKGGGAIRGMGEKFAANPVTGTGSMTVPIAVTPGRSGFSPQLSLSYDSGSGNGPFGLGWNLSLPAITRRTDKGLPKYEDAEESDVFILSGAEDLVPVLIKDCDEWRPDVIERTPTLVDGARYRIRRYRPRIEGLFARIERWTNVETCEIHWRSISKNNITTFYGKTAESRIADPDDPQRVFTWLICESRDDKGNAIGSTAPFVGLFGTVIGIIDAFQSMNNEQTAGFSTVAGGISEALVTTAFGLVVAIPAVWAFNYFTNRVNVFGVEMSNSADELMDFFLQRQEAEIK